MKNKKHILKKIGTDYYNAKGKKKVIFYFFLAVLVTAFSVIEPLFFAEIIRKIEEFYKTGTFDFIELYKFIGIWIGFIIVSILITYYYTLEVAEKSSLDLLGYQFKKNINKMLFIKYGEAISKEQGKLAKNFDRGIDAFFMIIYNFSKTILVPLMEVVAILGIMLYINVKMALISISVLPILIYFGFYFKNKTIKLQKDLDKHWENIFGKIGDTLVNVGLVKFLGIEKNIKEGLLNKYSEVEKIQKTIQNRWALSNIITQICIMIARLMVLGFGIYFIVMGEITLSVLFLFFSYVGFIYYPIGFIFNSLKSLQENFTKIERFYDEIETLKQDISTDTDINFKKFTNISGKIDFIDINFGYSSDKKIFEKLSFSIESGKKVAFVGNTGAGKSTIISLLFRLWDSQSGKILLDGEDIYVYSKESLRKNIGLVSQDNSLFNTSIRENLEYALEGGTKNENEEKINDALKKAHANFVFDLKDGIDTVIGERGLKLSGGEKQRLSIARLFLKNPKILILDEATSALDNKTEKFIQDSLDELMKGRTSIVIAHRLSTIQNADKIFMLENGTIIESGNYEELTAKKEKFFELANPDNLILK